MPEGPEIRLAADEVEAALRHRPVTNLFFAFEHLKQYESQFIGATVLGIDTYGKAMVTRFDNELAIYSHNQLYGIWMVVPAGEMPDSKRQLRLAIHNDTFSALLYSASDIELLRAYEVDTHPFIQRIGPDLLDMSLTSEMVAARLMSKAFRRRRFVSLLLDQRFLAGLGNYLRSEVAFVAGVHPEDRPVDCSPEQVNAIAEAALALTRQSYQTRGVTNDLGLAEKLKAEGVAYADYRFRVFNREDAACYQCGTVIEKDIMGGRRIYICPICQPRVGK